MLVRSPTFTNRLSSVMLTGSRPDSRIAGSGSTGVRGVSLPTASAIASMCAGVVPQQPPTMLTSPLPANSPSVVAIWSGVSSYSPNALGRPALGCTETNVSARRLSSAT